MADDLSALAESMPWGAVPARDQALRCVWDKSIQPRDLVLSLIYNPNPARKDVQVSSSFRRSNEFGPRHDAATALQDSLYIPGTGPLVFNFGGRPYFPSSSPLVFFDFRYEPEKPTIQPTDTGSIGARWQDARRVNLGMRVPWGKARILDGPLTGLPYVDYPGPVKPLPEPPPDPAIQDTYMIANIVNVVVLPSRTPIQVKNIRVGLDKDSFSWKFNCDIFSQAALALVKPGAGGAKVIEVSINGWVWAILVERYTRNRKFASEVYSISGSSRTQLLAAPFAPLRTGLNGAQITARQAAEAELQDTGFTLVWDAESVGPPDWTFPAGAFSYQSQTPIQVIARIAETVGAFVRPARDSDTLEVRPTYQAAPWAWGDPDAPIERVIPPAMMTDLNGDWTPQPAWNACYTSGTSHGCSMLVRRAGTAGDNPAPDVHDDWLTGEEANQQRGIHELSQGGDIEIVGFTLPLFHTTDDKGVGLVLPGMLCRVPEESGPWVGLCLGVDISATGTGASRVNQQLKLERHHSWPQ
ncbi:hypothetical protein [Pseudomonas sp. ML96]|uniref:hypothetical protein n=1 Tax=Pseudomonas sp. ML96 TaxID=1523503 RepID=UPI00210C8F50|nr:hypothetical protein [Pseudomonas sp. ML96]